MVFRAKSGSEDEASYVIMVAAGSEALAGRISASRGQEAAVCVCKEWVHLLERRRRMWPERSPVFKVMGEL